MQKIWEDKDLGNVKLRKYRHSKQYIIRMRGGHVSVSIPLYGSYKRAIQLVEEHRTALLERMKLYQSSVSSISSADEIELKKKALCLLPERLKQLALDHEFNYTSVKITKSKSRWGSCSSKKSINLSFYLLLLPEHLIDYVILHELCHTIHMNHGPEFWMLMNRVFSGKVGELRRELRQFHIPH